MEILRKYWAPLASGLVCFALGLSLGYRPTKGGAPDGKAPGEILKNGSLLLSRDPDAKVPSLPKVLPKGAKVERTVRVNYLPTAGTSGSSLPAEIDLNVLSMPDGSTRILAETTTGTITGGIDIPRAAAVPDLKWSAGGLYSPVQKTYGVFCDRDIGPWRVGLAVVQTQVQGLRSVDAWVKVGLRF